LKAKKEAGEHLFNIATIFSYVANPADADANGEITEEAKIEQLLGKTYYRTRKDTSKNWHEKPVLKSQLKLYYDQPQRRDSVFSEVTHSYNQIAKLPEESRYMMVNSEGEKTILKYNKRGICIQRNFYFGAVEYKLTLSDREN
jgi:hypothetical protein